MSRYRLRAVSVGMSAYGVGGVGIQVFVEFRGQLAGQRYLFVARELSITSLENAAHASHWALRVLFPGEGLRVQVLEVEVANAVQYLL